MPGLGELLVIGSTGTNVRQAVAFGLEIGWTPRQLDNVQVEPDLGPIFVALEDHDERVALISQLITAGNEPVTLVHPTAWVSPTARLGRNVMIGPQCVVAMDAIVGDGVVQNALGSIEHDNQIGAHTFLGTGVTLCGRITIGDHAFIGGGATIKPGVSIASHTTIGTGAVVVKDTEPHQTYVGNPARPLARSA